MCVSARALQVTVKKLFCVGHMGIPGNEKADQGAGQAIKGEIAPLQVSIPHQSVIGVVLAPMKECFSDTFNPTVEILVP